MTTDKPKIISGTGTKTGKPFTVVKLPGGKFGKGSAGPGRPKLPPGVRDARAKAKKVAAREKAKIKIPVSNPPPAPAPEPKPATVTPPTVSNPPAPAPDATIPPAKPDTALFGDFAKAPPASAPEPPPQNAPPPKPDAAGTPPPGSEEKKSDASSPADHRPVAEICFAMWTSIFAMIFGPFWFPRKVGTDVAAGEIPFDEKEPVIGALEKYFRHVGMIMLTPLQELWLALAGYSLPRFQATIAAVKGKFGGKRREKPVTPTAPAPETQRSSPAGETIDVTEAKEPAAPAKPVEPKPDALSTDEALAGFL